MESRLIRRSASLPEEVANQLREAIGRGEMKPGDKMPTQHALCDAYGVSRPVIREAISLLKSEGLVLSQQGRGQFVNPEGSGVFRLKPDLADRADLTLLLEFLKSVEVAATQLAAERHTPEDLLRIKEALDDLAKAIERGESGVDEDMRFHAAIVQTAKNHYFGEFATFLEGQVRRLIRTARANTARHGDLVRAVHGEHEAIYQAIAARDVDRARQAAAQHLTNAATRLAHYRENQPPG
ncbi:FadR/GntR family transcriptional regulator [Rhodospirillum sp. A1_3_36]|uniref:FadR/GntR family transcriptional regulator n=1 Tax=Rhodospirillum sp. A1_3_36 TaxID=3391666 RepID=UPI0039A7544A